MSGYLLHGNVILMRKIREISVGGFFKVLNKTNNFARIHFRQYYNQIWRLYLLFIALQFDQILWANEQYSIK